MRASIFTLTSFLTAVAAISPSDICDDWVGSYIFETFDTDCTSVFEEKGAGDKSMEDLCVDLTDDRSPTAVVYATNCCASKVSKCPVSKLCMDDSLYNPFEFVFSSILCGQSASQWAYSNLTDQCAINSGIMASFANRCCSDGISACPVSQLCMNDKSYDPHAKVDFGNEETFTCGMLSHQWAYLDLEEKCSSSAAEMNSFAEFCCTDGLSACSTSQLCMSEESYDPQAFVNDDQKCLQLAHQWAYEDLDEHCTEHEAEMSYFATHCCTDKTSACPVSQLCRDASVYRPDFELSTDQKCEQFASHWAYDDIDDHCASSESDMIYYANLCCEDGISVCPGSQLCRNSSEYTPQAEFFEGQKCREFPHHWAYSNLNTQCFSSGGLATMTEWAFNCCGDFESVCGFFPICKDNVRFTRDDLVDMSKYGSRSGYMTCAEIAKAVTLEYSDQLGSFCGDGNIPDLSQPDFSAPDIYAFECCSDQVSICAETVQASFTIEMNAFGLATKSDLGHLEEEIASALGLHVSDVTALTVTSPEAPFTLWNVAFTVALPIPSFATAATAVRRALATLETPAFADAVEETVGYIVEGSVATTFALDKETTADDKSDKKENDILTLLILGGVAGAVLLCALCSCLLPSKRVKDEPPPVAPPGGRPPSTSGGSSSKRSRRNGSKKKQRPELTEAPSTVSLPQSGVSQDV